MIRLLESLFRLFYAALKAMQRLVEALDRFWSVVVSASLFLFWATLDVAAMAAIQAGTFLLARWCVFPARYEFMAHDAWDRVIPWFESFGTFPAVLVVALGETFWALWFRASLISLFSFRMIRVIGDEESAHPQPAVDPDEVEMPDPLWF